MCVCFLSFEESPGAEGVREAAPASWILVGGPLTPFATVRVNAGRPWAQRSGGGWSTR